MAIVPVQADRQPSAAAVRPNLSPSTPEATLAMAREDYTI